MRLEFEMLGFMDIDIGGMAHFVGGNLLFLEGGFANREWVLEY